MEYFSVKTKFESNKKYIFDNKNCDIFLSDTKSLNEDMGEAVFIKVLDNIAFLLKDLENVTLNFNNSKLIFNGAIKPFFIYNCKNITIKNLQTDYSGLPYFQAEIIEAEKGKLKVKIDDSVNYEIINKGLKIKDKAWGEIELNKVICLGQVFDKTTKVPVNCSTFLGSFGEKLNIDHNPTGVSLNQVLVEKADKGCVRFYGDFDDSYLNQVGQIIAVIYTERANPIVSIIKSKNITLENIRSFCGDSAGILGFRSENIFIKDFKCFLDSSCKGVISINADAIHCSFCSGKITVDGCIFENMLDDGVNIHGNYVLVEKNEGNKITALIPKKHLENCRFFEKGDGIVIYKSYSQEIIDKALIKDVKYIDGKIIEIILDKEVKVKQNDLIESMLMPEIEIINSRIGKNRPRGVLLSSTKKSIVRNCHFIEAIGCAIHFTGDNNLWYESGPVGDVLIEDCIFENCCIGGGLNYVIMATPEVILTPKVPYYHRNIKIINNKFIIMTGGMLYAENAKNIVFKGNKYILSDKYKIKNLGDKVLLKDCSDCEVE